MWKKLQMAKQTKKTCLREPFATSKRHNGKDRPDNTLQEEVVESYRRRQRQTKEGSSSRFIGIHRLTKI